MMYLASLTEEMKDKVQGYCIIKTLDELEKIVAETKLRNSVLIRRDFAKEYFTPSGLNKYVENVRRLNRNLTITIDEGSDVLTEERFIKKLAMVRNADEMLSLLSAYPKEFVDVVKTLTEHNQEGQDELLAASNRVSRLQSIIDNKNEEIENLRHALRIEQMNKADAQARLDVLIKRINYQYPDMQLDKSKLFSIDENSYDRVIYIKEITRVQYVDSFVYYLKEIIKVLYSMPTRLVTIEGYYASGRPKLYPNLVPHYELKEHDVLAGDILMLGLQPKLMEDILRNPSHVSILIVLDRGGYMQPHIKGKNVEYFYTASDTKDLSPAINKDRIISYDPETLFIPLIEGFDELDEGERISKYSSMEIMKRIIACIESR